MAVSNKRQAFINEYLIDFNATQAAIRAGYSKRSARSIAQEMLTKPDILDAIKQRVDEMTMQADEILLGFTEQARGNMGIFFKMVEEWTYWPLPSYDIIDAKEVVDDTDPDNPVTRTSYWVRHVTIDLDKLMNPKYSGLVQEFSDSPRDGLKVKLYSRQAALQTLAKIRKMLIDRMDVTSGGKPIPVSIIEVVLPPEEQTSDEPD